jgi:hypothetical protein
MLAKPQSKKCRPEQNVARDEVHNQPGDAKPVLWVIQSPVECACRPITVLELTKKDIVVDVLDIIIIGSPLRIIQRNAVVGVD